MRPLHLLLLLQVLAVLPAGCAQRRAEDDPGQGPGPGNQSSDGGQVGVTLTLSPADPVWTVDGKTPITQAFTALRGKEDVSKEAFFSLDDGRLGSFQGNVFTATPTITGRTTVRARVGDDTGSTSLTLRARAVVVTPGTPADAPTRFMGPADAGRAPMLAYPPPGALIPPNLHELEFQWRKAMGTDLFELSLTGEGIELLVYTTCNAVGEGCGYTPDETSWKLLASGARNGTVQVKVRATSLAGGPVGTSGMQALSFGAEDIQGGLYYWGATANGVYRYDFGRRGQKAEPYYVPGPAPQAGLVTCVGCHAMSRNGKRIAAGVNIPGPSALRVLDVASRNKLFEVGVGVISGSNFQAFSADGSRLITVENGGLVVRDGTSGMVLGKTPQIANANMPDIASDGSRVVFARAATPCNLGPCTLEVSGASLFVSPFAGDVLGAEQALVRSGGENNFYPSFSPDSKYVVFNRASSGASYDNMAARVMIVPAAGGNVIDLKSANGYEGNSWPKWAPFVQRFQGKTILWLTFSSRRPYGLRTPSAAQLWLVPVSVDKLQLGQDPGFPPVWLPFQNIGTGNHIAQWVEKVERPTCTMNSDCPNGEICEAGVCVPVIK
jgi:hypothetical protein